MRVLGTNVVHELFKANASDHRIGAARSSYRAWEEITRTALWTIPQDVKSSHPKASILKGSRVIFNIKGNDFRLVCDINYAAKLVVIRWFGSHADYDELDVDGL